MKRERDGQRQKVYRAEGVLRAFSKRHERVADIEALVARVWASERVRARYGGAFTVKHGGVPGRLIGTSGWFSIIGGVVRSSTDAPAVRDGRGHRRATGSAYAITMPMFSRWTHIILHELAHTITIRHYGDHVAGHGWQWCEVYLYLVRLFMGREAHAALAASFKAARVRTRPPRQTAALSPERRAKLVAQLATARRQKAAITAETA